MVMIYAGAPPTSVPLTDAERKALSDLAREKPNSTIGQFIKIFQSRTGRKIGRGTAVLARRGHFDRQTDRYHLSAEERALLCDLIREAAPDYCWIEIARSFGELTGRTIDYQVPANYARKMGVAGPLKPGAKPGATARTADHNVSTAHTSKLASAPYRPGYFAKSYRGPDGDGVRVYRATGPAKGEN